ncbi:nucleotide 5'-monophosphate nucleosidase PpnN [Halioxenophilus sp. WMMB6]|uniref:nucleotide 5'-monophosphate nucleosidase PpnN n=1 Tax=Halioxenophilus sp. WMMB6 TaxID=3073815 RepID=UPI00295EB8C8|nr:nucleotide 5'-monophosphate nucleosidase PpnN [Halioxenophilus sp. WMMB6]
MDTSISPRRSLEILSQREVESLRATSQDENSHYALFRQCALAILHSGTANDDAKTMLETYHDFDIDILQQDRGLRLNLKNAPADAFVDGEMIASSREMIFSALRDILYWQGVRDRSREEFETSAGITDYVFQLLRNARALHAGEWPRLVVCWGGHSIDQVEYDYCKDVGHELGLRKLDICTGCGPGAMKGPMKGATIAHSKQRISHGRYLGITEPGIIAAEAPNPIVNELIILPDIEKRLEAFVRMGHGIIVFPGGAGTAEEVLYLLGILLHPDNNGLPFPLIFTGPPSSESYFVHLHEFIGQTLGIEAQQKYRIIIGNSQQAAREMARGVQEVREFRIRQNDAFYFNWALRIEHEFQQPFAATHENMANLSLDSKLPKHVLAANLRRAFSGIVAGNVKPHWVCEIEKHGPYQIRGDAHIKPALDRLLQAFIDQKRMKLPGSQYIPCYEIV